MTVQEAISARHSVRTYLTKPVEPAIVNALRAEIRACNAEGGLHCDAVEHDAPAAAEFPIYRFENGRELAAAATDEHTIAGRELCNPVRCFLFQYREICSLEFFRIGADERHGLRLQCLPQRQAVPCRCASRSLIPTRCAPTQLL